MKYIYFIFVLAIIAPLQAQQLLNSHPVEKLREDVLPVEYIDNDSLLHILFLRDKSFVRLDYDRNFNVSGEHAIDLPRRKNDNFLGQTVTPDGHVHLYFTNSRLNKFSLVDYNTGNSTLKVLELDLKLRQETFLNAFAHDNAFHFLTVDFEKNLNLYTLNGAVYFKTSFPLQDLRYKSTSGSSMKYINHALKTGNIKSVGTATVELLAPQLPNSLNQAASYAKLMHQDNTVYLLVDLDDQRTDVIEISLDERTAITRSFPQPLDAFESGVKLKSNSYLHENLLYQVAATSNKMVLQISDYTTGQEVRRFMLQPEDSITFANSNIVQVGGFATDYREHTKTSKLLRKMYRAFPGVSVHRHNGNLELTLGGSTEQGTTMGEVLGMVAAAAIVGVAASNSGGAVYHPYDAYTGSYGSNESIKSTYIISHLDDNLNHRPGNINNNIWDRLDLYVDALDDRVSKELVFPLHDHIMYGYYNRKEHTYNLVRFKRP